MCLFHILIYLLQTAGGLDWLATGIILRSGLILTYPNFRNKACPIRKASYYMMQAFVNDILITCKEILTYIVNKGILVMNFLLLLW